jgi:hypothetical protein
LGGLLNYFSIAVFTAVRAMPVRHYHLAIKCVSIAISVVGSIATMAAFAFPVKIIAVSLSYFN